MKRATDLEVCISDDVVLYVCATVDTSYRKVEKLCTLGPWRPIGDNSSNGDVY